MDIRLSTARTILIGPILDADGVAKTNEVVASILISKNGGAQSALNASATLTHSHTGYYLLALTASDTDTLGCLELGLNSTTNAMPIRSLNVMPAAVWDALYAASGGLIPADKRAVLGTALTETSSGYLAAGEKKFFDVDAPTLTVASVNQTGDSFNRIGAAGAGLTALGDTRLANLDAAVSTRSTYAGADTSGTTTLLARVPQVISMAQVGGSGPYYVEAVRHDGELIHQAGAAVAKSPATLAEADVTGNLPANVNTVRDRTAQDVGAGNTAYFGTVAFPSSWPANWSWGTSTLTQADIRTAVGLASANLDTQLTAINGYVDVLPTSWVTVPTAAQNADAVWDEQLTGATHNIATSAGRRLRQLAAQIVIDGTAAGSTSNTIVLDSDASAVDGAYDPSLIFISGGTGEGQCRLILEYDGGTKTAVVDRNWKVNPVSGNSTYVIMGDAGREHVNEGLAQAGGTSTITLNPLASSSDNCYIAQRVFIRSGTGEDQSRRVIAYNGTTKVATVSRPWDTVPDVTSAYVMLPTGAINDNDLSTAVLDEPSDQHTIAGTVGAAIGSLEFTTVSGNKYVKSDTVAISGDTDPADRLARSAATINLIVVGSGSTRTSVVVSAINPDNVAVNGLRGKVLLFTSDTATVGLRGQPSTILANTAGSTPTLTLNDSLTSAPSAGDTAVIT